jgi:ketopantoate reductase
MHQPVVIIGIGEMAGVFARGFLRIGIPVYPVIRGMDIQAAADAIPQPEFVLIGVGEKDLHATLEKIPPQWRDRLVLLQNELLPRDWRSYPFTGLTVISVWFEKKKGQDIKLLLASPAFGPHAGTLQEALGSLDIPCRVVDSAAEMEYELVRKNVYIVTTNVAGLETGGNVAELWRDHETLARAVANEVMEIQQSLVEAELPRRRLLEGMLEAFAGDPEHKCMGRSAPDRLQRALQQAEQAGIEVPTLKRITANSQTSA